MTIGTQNNALELTRSARSHSMSVALALNAVLAEQVLIPGLVLRV